MPWYFDRAAPAAVNTELAPAAAKPATPDLVMKSLTAFPAWPKTIDSGGSITVVTRVQNSGKAAAPVESLERFYLSTDKIVSSNDVALAGDWTVPVLAPKEFSERSTALTIPAATPTGAYYIIACADDTKAITEKNEKNNCKTSKKFQVVNTNTPVAVPVSYDLPVAQGTASTVSVPVDDTAGSYSTMTLNLQDILATSITITPTVPGITKTPLAAAPVNMSMTMRIGQYAGTVCQDGLLYGPFIVSGSSASPTVYPPTAAADPTSVNIINAGSYAICMQVVSDTDVDVKVGDLSVDATKCSQPPADMSGTWAGTYTCINHGWPNDRNQPISLTVTQDGNRASYTDDGGDTYVGTVCGNVFTFSRNTDFEVEKGTFVVNKNGTAVKTSTWKSVFSPDTNWGNCTDKVKRQ
jgi:hypothetical protein